MEIASASRRAAHNHELRIISITESRHNRKNYLFAGSDAGGDRAAAIYSLLGPAKLNGLNLQAFLREVIARIADHRIARTHELLPWNLQLPTTTALNGKDATPELGTQA